MDEEEIKKLNENLEETMIKRVRETRLRKMKKMRDKFAIQALNAIIISGHHHVIEVMVARAYEIANLMMKQREEK